MICLMEPNETSIQLLNRELRHVEASKLNKLSAILDQDMGWKVLLQELTRPDGNDETGISNSSIWNLDAINLIEQQIYCGKSPTRELLNYWAITGRRRPTIKSLTICLRSCNLKRAEDYALRSILGLEPLTDPQNLIPAVQVTLADGYNIPAEFRFDNLHKLLDDVRIDCSRYSFKSLYESTNGFCHKPHNLKDQSGTKIGEGRFSSVFRAKTSFKGQDQIVAAKLLKSDCNINYIVNEIKLMVKVKHENILELLGIAIDRSAKDQSLAYMCLIYQYMENGSLLDCLSSGLPTRNRIYLSCTNRISIAVKVARGISYLHSFHEDPIVHRDIKTANILLNGDLNPKIGDFTLVRQIETLPTGETQYSQNVIGTSVYMSPEAFRGDISKKSDVFSYGIVLFELLTGLRPFDDESNEDLLTFITGKLSDVEEESYEESSVSISIRRDELLKELLDKKAGDWEFPNARTLFELAIKSSETNKKKRPEIESILPDLEHVLAKCSRKTIRVAIGSQCISRKVKTNQFCRHRKSKISNQKTKGQITKIPMRRVIHVSYLELNLWTTSLELYNKLHLFMAAIDYCSYVRWVNFSLLQETRRFVALCPDMVEQNFNTHLDHLDKPREGDIFFRPTLADGKIEYGTVLIARPSKLHYVISSSKKYEKKAEICVRRGNGLIISYQFSPIRAPLLTIHCIVEFEQLELGEKVLLELEILKQLKESSKIAAKK